MFELEYLLDSILGPHHRYANNEYYYNCPECLDGKSPKFAVNLHKKKWHCWRCGMRGNNIISLLYKIHASPEDIQEARILLDEWIPEVKKEIIEEYLRLPEEYVPLTTAPQSVQDYVFQRGLTAKDIYRFQLGYCVTGKYANRIIVPSYAVDGTLNYFIARDYTGKSFLKYLNPPASKNVIVFEQETSFSMPIILCEGTFDAMTIKRNAVPLLGTYLPRKLKSKILQHKTPVYLALDNDALSKTGYIAEKLMKEGISVFIVNLNEKDPSEVGFSNMQHLIREAKKLTFVDLIKFKLN